MPEVPRVDEFVFVVLAGLVLIIILTLAWSSTYQVDVKPTTKTLTIASGSSATFTLVLNGTSKDVNLVGSGEIGDWLSFDRNNFDISGLMEIHVTVNVPPNTPLKVYNGKIEVNYPFGQKTVSISVNVSTITISENVTRVFGPEDFIISYFAGTKTIFEKKSFTVEKGLFVDKPLRVIKLLTDEELSMATKGFIDMTIYDTNYEGNLIVEFNGKEIFNDKPDWGKISLDLSKNQLQPKNTIVIRAGSTGWKFWTKNFYDLENIIFGIDFEKASFKEFSFNVNPSDLENFKFCRISFRIRNYDLSRMGDMTIKVNDKIVFKGVPTLTYFSTIFGNEIPLNIGLNRISFSVDRDSFYDLTDVTLSIIKEI
jgi:hypothetical protein